jgi:hypothetical protein
MTILKPRRGRPPGATPAKTATERSRKRNARLAADRAAALGAPDLPEIPWNEHCADPAFKPVYEALVALVLELRLGCYGGRIGADIMRGGVANG